MLPHSLPFLTSDKHYLFSLGKTYLQENIATHRFTAYSGSIIIVDCHVQFFFFQGIISFSKTVLYNSKLIELSRNIRVMYAFPILKM